MSNYRLTITTASLLFRQMPETQEEVAKACSDMLGVTLKQVEEGAKVTQACIGVGATTVQTKEGQCVVLFIATCDQEPRP